MNLLFFLNMSHDIIIRHDIKFFTLPLFFLVSFSSLFCNVGALYTSLTTVRSYTVDTQSTDRCVQTSTIRYYTMDTVHTLKCALIDVHNKMLSCGHSPHTDVHSQISTIRSFTVDTVHTQMYTYRHSHFFLLSLCTDNSSDVFYIRYTQFFQTFRVLIYCDFRPTH